MKRMLNETHSELVKEWNYNKNKVKPNEVTHGSGRKVWWKCKKGHEWQAYIYSRAGKGQHKCPYCSGRLATNENCFSNKDLIKEWDFNKNEIKPSELKSGSGKKVWWKCKKGHEWKCSLYRRTKGHNCPYCTNNKVCNDNCLATTHPELIKEWNYDKNNIKPIDVLGGSRKKVWWKCKKGHEWQDSLNHRTQGRKCHYCSGKKICQDNCLLATHPHSIKEWSNKNKIKPNEITYSSNKKVWWKCEKGHEWLSTPNSRIINNSIRECPYCTNRKVCKDNCLKFIYPELAKEWSNKNKLKPTDVLSGSHLKVWWECQKCKHEWITSIMSRSNKKSGCPVCNESKGEKEVAKTLEQLNIKYKREYRFKELNRQPFDFAIFKKYARNPYAVIEYQGEQHYMILKYGNKKKKGLINAKKRLKEIQKRDMSKRKFCQNNNIKLIEIPYTDFNNIEQIIKKEFN